MKISNILNDILYIVFTCETLKACLSKHIKKAKLKSNRSFESYNQIDNFDIHNILIELIENYPCDDGYSLNVKKQK